jgi:hypothetical protein
VERFGWKARKEKEQIFISLFPKRNLNENIDGR